MNWDTEKDISDISLKKVESMCKALKDQKDKVKDVEDQLKTLKAEETKLKNNILDILVEHGKTKYNSEVGLVYTSTNFSVTTPKTEEEKTAFFDWAKKEGIYLEYATVNSKKLGSLYKSMLETEGAEFTIPGVGEPTTFDKLNFRQAK